MIRVLLADDHAILRGGLKQLFSLTGDIVVAGEASDGSQVLAAVREGSYDLVLLDLTMPGLSGMALIARLAAGGGHPRILVLSMHNEVQAAKRALQAGASGFVTKGSDPEVLLAAVRKVAAGGRYIDPLLAEQMMFEKPAAGKQFAHERLSERELQIMQRLARGQGVVQIAQELFISHKTVSTHKARLMEKMGFGSNTDLVRYAIDHGLVN